MHPALWSRDAGFCEVTVLGEPFDGQVTLITALDLHKLRDTCSLSSAESALTKITQFMDMIAEYHRAIKQIS